MKERTGSRRILYSPGEQVASSGVYQVKHLRHRLPHEATLLEGEAFPYCKYCRAEVRFRLVRAAKRPEKDQDFRHHTGPMLIGRQG